MSARLRAAHIEIESPPMANSVPVATNVSASVVGARNMQGPLVRPDVPAMEMIEYCVCSWELSRTMASSARDCASRRVVGMCLE